MLDLEKLINWPSGAVFFNDPPTKAEYFQSIFMSLND